MKAQDGSTLPLVIGFAAILLALTLGLGEVLSLRLTQNRVLGDATFAAVYLTRESQDVPFVKGLDYSAAIYSQVPQASALSAVSNDGKTIRVIVCEMWESPFGLHSAAEVCDEALARTNPFGS